MKNIYTFCSKKLMVLMLLLVTLQTSLWGMDNPEKGRFSMFIHWGLYSVYGGVYKGNNIEKGYSEQIQSFAGIFSNWYARAASSFDATEWNADSIAVLAKKAGMEGIVMTSKHHDGFCMYNSKYTDYTITKMTPFGRDPLLEMSEACKRHGLNFGIYFSLIDWHYPPAYPISSHNADPIPPEHHEYNKAQVRELLENYGPVSELWFDMGSLRREQSKELYDLVKSIQPKCMVSGRIGNDYGDFVVMPDNTIPEFKMEKPWQTAQSVYKETWGYRSWQKHVPLQEKLNEKIGALKTIISSGGNYLLNIGPDGDGAVTDFEKKLLLGIGKWIDSTGWLAHARDSIYNVKVLPNKSKINLPRRKAMSGGGLPLFIEDATELKFFSMFDYYNTNEAVYGYRWTLPVALKRNMYRFIVPDIECDFEVEDISGNVRKLTNRKEVMPHNTVMKYLPVQLKGSDINVSEKSAFAVIPDVTVPKRCVFNSPKDGMASFKVGVADAVEIVMNGQTVLKKMFTNKQPEPFVFAVPVVKGENTIEINLYNRFERVLNYSLESVDTKYFEIW